MEHVDPVVYCLTLTPKYAALHDVFYVFMLKKCHHDPSHIIPCLMVPIHVNIAYKEYPVEIINRMKNVLCNKRIFMVKVLWQHYTPEEAT